MNKAVEIFLRYSLNIFGVFLLSISFLTFDSEFLKAYSYSTYSSIGFLFSYVGLLLIIVSISTGIKAPLIKMNDPNLILLFWMAIVVVSMVNPIGIENYLYVIANVLVQVSLVIMFFMARYVKYEYCFRKVTFLALLLFTLAGAWVHVYYEVLNKNWVSLLVSICCIYFWIFFPRKRLLGLLIGIFGFIFTLYVGARGVSLILLISLIVIVFNVDSVRFAKNAIIVAVGLTVFIPFIGGFYFYGSDTHQMLEIASREETGRTLTSSRIERWNYAIQSLIDSKYAIFTGFGLDALARDISADQRIEKLEASHSLFIDTIFLIGIFGLIIKLFFYWRVMIGLFLTESNKANRIFLLSAIFISISALVYGIGGFTHFPGLVFVFFMHGVLWAYRDSLRKYRIVNAPSVDRFS